MRGDLYTVTEWDDDYYVTNRKDDDAIYRLHSIMIQEEEDENIDFVTNQSYSDILNRIHLKEFDELVSEIESRVERIDEYMEEVNEGIKFEYAQCIASAVIKKRKIDINLEDN